MNENVVYINKPPEVKREESIVEALSMVKKEVDSGNISSLLIVLVSEGKERDDITTLLAGEIMQQDQLLAVGLLESVKLNIIHHLTD